MARPPLSQCKMACTQIVCAFDKLDKLRQQVEEGIISLRVADTVTPENAFEAHKRLDAGGTRGRMVINWE